MEKVESMWSKRQYDVTGSRKTHSMLPPPHLTDKWNFDESGKGEFDKRYNILCADGFHR